MTTPIAPHSQVPIPQILTNLACVDGAKDPTHEWTAVAPHSQVSHNRNPNPLACIDLGMSSTHQSTAVGPGKAPMGKPDWAHIFLTVLDPLPIHSKEEQKQAATALRAAGAAVMSRHSTALRKAGLAQWELRLCVPHGMPAWRIVVSSPTGNVDTALPSLRLDVTVWCCFLPGGPVALSIRLSPHKMSACRIVRKCSC